MKKLFFILALLVVVAITARGQTATFEITPQNNMYSETTDYTLTNTTVMWFQFNAARGVPSTQDYQVNLDSLTGNHTNIAIKLFGRKFSGSSWVQIGSTINSVAGDASAGGAKTEELNNTAANRYRSYKAEFTGTGTGTTTIDFQKLKLWNE